MGRRSPGALAVQCVFVVLVLATFAAFFVTTRLKRSPPVVEQLSFRRYFSPNADGRADVSPVSFRLRRSDNVSVSIVNDSGARVAVLADDAELGKGRHRYAWDGRDEQGKVVPDGTYYVRIGLRHQGRTITSPRKMFVDTAAPESIVKYVSPDVLSPGGSSEQTVRVRFVGPTRIAPTLLVYRSDGTRSTLVARRSGKRRSGVLTWDGRVGLGRQQRSAPPGNYLMAVRTRDAAGNDGPAQLPPTRASVRGNPGLIVRYLAAVPPQNAVRAGQVVKFNMLAAGRRYDWQLRRAGTDGTLKRGSSAKDTLSVRIPNTGKSGVFTLDSQLGSRRYSAPFAVQGSGGSKVLLVLPQTTWTARDPLDSDGDGFADVMPGDRKVPLVRPMIGDGLPPAFESQVRPLLDYLDMNGLRFDIATDSKLPPDGQLAGYSGVLYAGPPLFTRVEVGQALRFWVRAGGVLAWLGNGGFTSTARAAHGQLVLARSTASSNLFGERLRLDPIGGLLSVDRDDGRLFEGLTDPFGPLDRLETQVAGPRVRSAAGVDDGPPALVQLGVGKGSVIRIGAEGFAASLGSELGLQSSDQMMENVWNSLR